MKFKAAKNEVAALPVTGASLGTRGILTPNKAKKTVISQKKSYINKYTETSILYTFEYVRK